MQPSRSHALSFFAGLGLAAVAFVAMGQASAPHAVAWEYRIVSDPDQDELQKLAAGGWEYGGYLGRGKRGADHDEMVWKRPSK